ncbi:MAG: tetratricopeptide repeat protein [Phycisphaerales bacterium JB040]
MSHRFTLILALVSLTTAAGTPVHTPDTLGSSPTTSTVAQPSEAGAAGETLPGPERWDGLLREATEAFGAGHRERALPLAQRALDMARNHFEELDPRQVRSRLFVASILMQSGRMDEALPLAEEANEISERILDEAQTRVASTLKFLGAAHLIGGQTDDAERVYRRAVELSERANGVEHTETAKHLGNLAGVLIQQGETHAARDMVVRALRIWHLAGDLDPVYTVGSMIKLADLEISENRHDRGLEMYESALDVQERAWGAASPRLADLLSKYAGALRRAGREELADQIDTRLESLAHD